MKIRELYAHLFRILLGIAAILSLLNELWINIILIITTFLLISLPQLIGEGRSSFYPSKLEIVILLLIYVVIIVENLVFIPNSSLWVRVFFYFVISTIIGMVGFSLIYLLNNLKRSVFDLEPHFIAFFAFCFSLSLGALWQIFRFGMDYVFGFSIQNYNSSDALGFLAIHSIGAGLVSLLGYLFISDTTHRSILRPVIRYLSKIHPSFFGSMLSSKEYIISLLEKGESSQLEFKSTLRTNLHTGEVDKRIEHAVLKTLNAFMNSKGGILLIGVNDNGEIIGITQDKFKDYDKLSLHLTNLIKQHIGPDAMQYVSIERVKLKRLKHVVQVAIKKSERPIFMQYQGNEEFFIRTGPSSLQLSGSKLVSYVRRHFKKS